MTGHGWWHDAMCKGKPVDQFDIDRLPSTHRRSAAAQAMCTGCPVVAQCAADALANWGYTFGHVVAGVAVAESAPSRRSARARLQVIAGQQVAA